MKKATGRQKNFATQEGKWITLSINRETCWERELQKMDGAQEADPIISSEGDKLGKQVDDTDPWSLEYSSATVASILIEHLD